jgi:hypothetical protein
MPLIAAKKTTSLDVRDGPNNAKQRVAPLTTTATVLAKSAQPPIGSFAEVTGQTTGRTPSSKRKLQHPAAKTTKSSLRVCEIQPA